DEREGPINVELSGKVGSDSPVPPEEYKLKDDYVVSVQNTESSKLSPSVIETLPAVDLHEESSSVVVSSENIENISSSSTSEITPISKLDEIEKSGTIPIAKPSETEQSESDCDVGEALGANDPVDQPSFVSPPESLVGQHIENVSSSHGKGKITKSEFESKVSSGDQGGGDPKSALNASDNLKNESSDYTKPGEIDPTSVTNPKDPEDIPTFDEWKKKVMEVEKEKSQSMHPSSNGGLHATKKVQKNRNNYASVECGAKILAANPEAKSTSAILIENMDLYMLNPCSTKIWFVIELCEPIQVKQFDIANYELFSSTPKDFLVSISDRYPTNKWIKLGTFHGRDERNVQSFPLDEQMYAKYVKVELISHFGSEHFCPLSLIRVFGTSMVEEYEEIADSQYQSERQELFDEDYDLGYANGNLVHGSNQKESVFMRLNNRIKALEVNMSLSGRYLEELSQRYRKQMEEMQKAFNKTIIKLQNTSRIAEEQDQRQTEAIQLLQAQLTNMTQLVSNLSTTVAELKHEKKRCKYKAEKVETIKPADPLHPIANGDIKGRKPFTNQRDFSNMGEVYHSSYKGPPSEGSSETSSQSEESYFCGISACTSLCNGQSQKTKTEKRALKRRRSKVQDQGKLLKTLIQTKSGSLPSLHDIIKGNKELTVGTFGVTAVSGQI
ncbi:hypothetical protein CB1_001016001, partial [Camelus ferus]